MITLVIALTVRLHQMFISRYITNISATAKKPVNEIINIHKWVHELITQ